MQSIKEKVSHERTLELPKREIEGWNALIEAGHIDYDAHGFKEFSTIWCKTVKFEDGFEVDLKVCTDGGEDGTAWSEAVLFDENGIEFSHTDVCEGIDGDFFLSYFDHKTEALHEYMVKVVGV
jgi:hypothetical protein